MNFVQKWTNDYIHRVFKFGQNMYVHDCITLAFAENGSFTKKKGMEKLIWSFLEDNITSSVS
jgi:hypothetical protein